MKMVVRYWVAALALGLLVAAESKAATVDQEYLPTSSEDWAFLHVRLIAGKYLDTSQTFTAGLSGQLTRLDLHLTSLHAGQTSHIRWDIRPTTSSGNPVDDDTARLVTGEFFHTDTTGGFHTIDLFAQNFFVSSGDHLAIALSAMSGDVFWTGNQGPPDLYSGGAAHQRSNIRPSWIRIDGSGPIDLGFRSYIDTDAAVVPLPPTVALIATALVWCGFLGWRRRQPT